MTMSFLRNNALLGRLPAQDLERLSGDFEHVPMVRKQVLHKAGDPIQYVYFLTGGLVSITKAMRDGAVLEVATVGKEGLVGVGAFYNHPVASDETRVQVSGTDALRMPLAAFTAELDRGGAFYQIVLWYAFQFLEEAVRDAACAALHTVEQRLSRWLLTAHDRIGRDDLQITHDFLATVLGVRRPTVTIIAGHFQRSGFIDLQRGSLRIVNRAGLEAQTCECYVGEKGRHRPRVPMATATQPHQPEAAVSLPAGAANGQEHPFF